MTEIRLDSETLRLLALFENVTGARVKDVIEEEERSVFVVEAGQVGRAIGKGGLNLRRLRDVLKKDVEIIGFDPDRAKFIQNVFHKFKVQSIEFEERREKGDAVRVKVEPQDKGKAIGKGGRNVQLARNLAARHHNLSDVIVE